jgi:hypothetical protein
MGVKKAPLHTDQPKKSNSPLAANNLMITTLIGTSLYVYIHIHKYSYTHIYIHNSPFEANNLMRTTPMGT